MRPPGSPADSSLQRPCPNVLARLQYDQLQIMLLGHRYLASRDDHGNGRICERVCAMLTVHLIIEERLLFPLARRELDDDAWLGDAEIANYLIRGLIGQLHTDDLRLRHRDAAFALLVHYVSEHFGDARTALFEPLAVIAAREPALMRELDREVTVEKTRLAPWFGLADISVHRHLAY